MNRERVSDNLSPLGEAYFRENVGKTLRSRRQELGIKLSEIVEETKIPKHYLMAIEKSEWSALAHTIHILGFIRQYARVVGLDSEIAATKYLLERGPLSGSNPQAFKVRRVRSALVGSHLLIVGLGALVLIGVIGYLLMQLSILATPPMLEITAPSSDQQTADRILAVSGKTIPNAVVTINGSPISVKDDGSFKVDVSLNNGLNTFIIESRNRAGKTARAERSVIVSP